MTTIGLISPGQMGASVGAAAAISGARIIWAGEGRSVASHERAAAFTDCGSMTALLTRCEVILSVCPPHNAAEVAGQVAAARFKGLFLDANAIAPDSARQYRQQLEAAGATFVDGGIIGGPAWHAGSGTRLYLSGSGAADVAALFAGSPLHTRVISDRVGAASAMKMVFAAYTKGTTALLTAILSVAEHEGVRDCLEAQWGHDFSAKTHQRITDNSAKAWRFVGEMREIAATFDSAGMPGSFHTAAAEVFEQLSVFKDNPATDIASLLARLLQSTDSG